MRRLRAAPGPVHGEVTVPGSKSIANRALVIAALADGESTLTNIPDGDDTTAMVGCLAALGIHVETDDDGTVLITGTGGRLRTAHQQTPRRARRDDVPFRHRPCRPGRRTDHDRRRSSAANSPDERAARRLERARGRDQLQRGGRSAPRHRQRSDSTMAAVCASAETCPASSSRP